MKSVAITAVLLGAASAHQNHARIHARSGWDNGKNTTTVTTTMTTTHYESMNAWGEWTSTTTTTKPIDPPTSTWAEWTSSTTTKTTVTDPWGEWKSSSSTTTKPKSSKTTTVSDPWAEWTSTSTKPKDPATSTEKTVPISIWAGWTSISADPATSTKTVTVVPVTTSASSANGWVEWSTSSTTGVLSKTVDPAVDGQCVVEVFTSYGLPIWKPDPAPRTSSTTTTTTTTTPSTSTWAVWTSTASSSASASSSGWASSSGADADFSWGSGTDSSSGSSSSSAASSSSTGSSSITTNGSKWSMTYSPYTAAGGCKDAGTVSSDIAALAAKGFTSVRVYSTDCSTLENVGAAARASNIKIILGVFISATGISGAQPQVTDITKWAQWDIVELIVVGNEAVYQGSCSASDLAGFISSSKWAFKAAGYTGLVTTTEPLSIWQSEGSTFCDVVDVISGNLYAFFNAQTTAAMAGDFIQSQIQILSGICAGKETYVMESGWPSAGNCNGVACPSPENQATAIKGIQSTSGARVVFFSFEDEAWKEPGEFNVEQHWGCSSVFD